MRLWQLLFAVAAVAVGMVLTQDPVTRVLMITMATGIGEVFLGLVSVMALFQTVGALGEAQGLHEHAEALGATAVVLAVATAVMSAWLFFGFWLIATFV
jgi:hypothetical protein